MDYKYVENVMRESGYKLTSQRELVFDCLNNSRGEHLTPDQIHLKLKEQGQDVGIATVYRTLLLFDDLGIVQKLSIDNEGTMYELVDELEGHDHHHLYCVKCEDVIEITSDLLTDVEEKRF